MFAGSVLGVAVLTIDNENNDNKNWNSGDALL